MADRKTEFWDIESLSELRHRCQKPGWTLRLFEWLRWPDGRICPHCKGRDHLPIEGRQKTGLYHCRGCRKQFSATSGTPLHKTKLPLETWMEAAFIIASSSKGVSSVILAQQLGVTQPTAWKVGHAIRLMMRPPANEPKLSGVVEVDDMALGEDPKRTNRRKYGTKVAKHIYNPPGRGSKKGRILAAAERGGRVRAKKMSDGSRATLDPLVKGMADQESSLMTDGDKTLVAIGKDYAAHKSVDHSADEFARGDAHVNTVEAFHLYVQRAKFGVWHRWSETHQQRYLDELAFHWDHRPQFRKFEVGGVATRQMIIGATPIILRMRKIFSKANRPSANPRRPDPQRGRAQDVVGGALTCCVSCLKALRDGGKRPISRPAALATGYFTAESIGFSIRISCAFIDDLWYRASIPPSTLAPHRVPPARPSRRVRWVGMRHPDRWPRASAGSGNDQRAVTAALSLPWSNGQTEGHITKLKLVKRSQQLI